MRSMEQFYLANLKFYWIRDHLPVSSIALALSVGCTTRAAVHERFAPRGGGAGNRKSGNILPPRDRCFEVEYSTAEREAVPKREELKLHRPERFEANR